MKDENENAGVSDEQLALTRQNAAIHNMNQRAGQRDDGAYLSLTPAYTKDCDLNNDNKPDTELLSSMIDNEHLFFTHKVNAGILSIQLRMTGLSASEQKKREEAEFKKYAKAVLDELDAFKQEKKLPEDAFKLTHDQENNVRVLTIAFSSPHFYKMFIQRLINSNLLPLQMTHPNFNNSNDVTKELFRNNYFYPRRSQATHLMRLPEEVQRDRLNPGSDDLGRMESPMNSHKAPEPQIVSKSSIPSPFRTPTLVPPGSTLD